MATERELAARFLAGEAEVVEAVLSWARLGTWSFKRALGDEWEDAVAEAVAQVTEAIRGGRFRGNGSLRAYVRRVAGTTCLDRLRHRRRWRMTGLDETLLPPVARTPADAVEAASAWQLAGRVLAELSADCVRLLEMVVAGASYRQMAATVGASEGALRVRVLRCRRRAQEIRRALERNESGTRTP